MFNSLSPGSAYSQPSGLIPTTLLPLLSIRPRQAPTSGSATSENGRNNTAFVHHSALGLLLNKCSEEFWWLAFPLGPGWAHSDFINTLWGDQKNKSPFIGSYMVTELFPHQLKFTFLSPCPHVDYLFILLLRQKGKCSVAQVTNMHFWGGASFARGEWRRHDMLVYAPFAACNCHWCCGNIFMSG